MAKTETANQLKNLYDKLTVWQKTLIAGVVAIVLGGIIYIIANSASGVDMALLYSGMEDSEMSKVVDKLKEGNIKYDLRSNNSIYIEKSKLYETRLSLAGEGLPESGTMGYELFDKTNIGMSEFVQKLNYRRALEGELSRTINSLDEVKKARVHLVIPEKALFDKDQKQPSASVILHLKTNKSLNNSSVKGIQNLVAGSIEGMQRDAVTVIDQRGKVLSDAPVDASSVAGLTKTQYEQQIAVEQYLANKVQGMLDGALGPGNAEVRVNSELDFTQIEKTITDYDPEKQALRSEQSVSDKSQSMDSLSYPAVSMARDQSNQIANYEVSKSVQKIIEGVGNLRRLSVAAMINGTVKINETDGKKSIQYIPRNEEEMQKLTELVKNAVGYDPSRNDQVSVLNVPFDTTYISQELETTHEYSWWDLQNPDTVKLLVLILAVLFTLFIMYRLMMSRPIRDKIRTVMSLPDVSPHGEIIASEEPSEDVLFDEDQLLFLPAELPEQLLLEGDRIEKSRSIDETEENIDREMITSTARAQLEGEKLEISEDDLMKFEIKGKVQNYLEDRTTDAVRLIRVFLSQDNEEKYKI